MRLAARRTLALLAVLAFAGAARAAAQTPTVTVSGVGYLQYLYQLKDTANHNNNFDVTRAYINVIGKFPAGISTRITGDIYRDADATAGGSLNYRLKYAYVTYAPEGSSLSYRFGQTQTPLLDWEEGLWDYRMQGTMPMERGGYVTSSDFGVAVDGNWGFDKVNLQAGVYNGEGYKGGLGDQRKDIEGRVSVRLMGTDEAGSRGGLRLTGFVDYGTPTGGGQRQRYLGMLSYKTKQYTLAAEYASTKDSSTTTPTPSTSGSVLSVYGVAKIPSSKFAIVARVDVLDPNTNTTTGAGATQTRIIGGVSYQVTPNFRAMIDLDNNSFAGGSTPVQDLTRSTLYFHTQMTF